MAADETGQDLESTLNELSEEADQQELLRAVARGEILVPQLDENAETSDSGASAADSGSVQLPFIEQEGTHYVLAFSSGERLAESGIDADSTVTVRGANLAAAWPADEELWLAINPGSERGVAVPPDAVRALPSLVEDE